LSIAVTSHGKPFVLGSTTMGGPDAPAVPAAPVVEPVLTLGAPPIVEGVEPPAIVEPPAPESDRLCKGDVPSTTEVHAVEVNNNRPKAQKILCTVHLQGKARQAHFARRDSFTHRFGRSIDLPVRLGTYRSRESGRRRTRPPQKAVATELAGVDRRDPNSATLSVIDIYSLDRTAKRACARTDTRMMAKMTWLSWARACVACSPLLFTVGACGGKALSEIGGDASGQSFGGSLGGGAGQSAGDAGSSCTNRTVTFKMIAPNGTPPGTYCNACGQSWLTVINEQTSTPVVLDHGCGGDAEHQAKSP